MLRAPKRIKASRYIGNAMKAGLMPCTQKYAATLIDPTSDASRGACVPSGFPIPSQKCRAFVRGTFQQEQLVWDISYGAQYWLIILLVVLLRHLGMQVHQHPHY